MASVNVIEQYAEFTTEKRVAWIKRVFSKKFKIYENLL